MMKQKRAHILPALLASLLLLVTTGCTRDQAGGIRYGANNLGNNGQVNEPLGNRGNRDRQATPPGFFNQPTGPGVTSPAGPGLTPSSKTAPKQTNKETQGINPGYALVTAQPLSPGELCTKVQKENTSSPGDYVWEKYEPLDKDGISNQCEALIMKSRYADNVNTSIEIVDPQNPSDGTISVTSFDLKDEYLAIHPARINGFLVGAVVFPEGEKGFKKMRKKIKNPAFAGMFTGKNKEYKDKDKEVAADHDNQDRVTQIFHRMRENLKRNSKLGENEASRVTLADGTTVKVPYSRAFFDLMYSLKNEGESDIQAYRRIFHGAVVDAQGNGDVLVQNILPTRDGLLGNLPVKVPAIDARVWPTLDKTVPNTENNKYVAVVGGGKVEPIPAPLNRPMTLGEISGLSAETNSLREAGSFQVTFETNLLLPQGSELAIGFLSKDTQTGRRIIGNSRLTGTFTTIVDGETALITSSTIKDGSNQNINSRHRYPIDRAARDGCKTRHVIINYVSNDEEFNTENNITPLSESVFYKLPGDDEPWKPMHAGMASVYPVANYKGVTCVPEKNRFFNTVGLNQGAVATQFYRDQYLDILTPKLSDTDGLIHIPAYLYGENEQFPAPVYAEIKSTKNDGGSSASPSSDEEEDRMIITVSGCDQVNTDKAVVTQLLLANGKSTHDQSQAVQSYEYKIKPSEICASGKNGNFIIQKIEIKSSVMDDHKWEGSVQFPAGAVAN